MIIKRIAFVTKHVLKIFVQFNIQLSFLIEFWRANILPIRMRYGHNFFTERILYHFTAIHFIINFLPETSFNE